MQQEFIDEFEAPNRPVIITDAMSHWPAMHKWTKEALLSKYGGVTFAAGSVDMRLDAFCRYSDAGLSTALSLVPVSCPCTLWYLLCAFLVPPLRLCVMTTSSFSLELTEFFASASSSFSVLVCLYLDVSVCDCVCMCVCVSVCVRVCARVRVCMFMRVRACMHACV